MSNTHPRRTPPPTHFLGGGHPDRPLPRGFPLPLHAAFCSHQLITLMELDDSEDFCPICQEDCKDPVQTLCQHLYCRECLQSWTDAHNTCPSCRKELYTARDIPARRLVTIPPRFFNQLTYTIYDHEEVQEELEYWDELVKKNEPLLPLEDDWFLNGNYVKIQPTIVAIGIWFWNKVDQDYEPHLWEMFKRDWIKVIHALDCELFGHDEWLGPVSYLRKRLVGAVLPSREEPRRAPADVRSWEWVEDGEAWYREHGSTWVSDGWQAHADRIRIMVEYAVRALWWCMVDEWSDSDDEDDDEEEDDDDGSTDGL